MKRQIMHNALVSLFTILLINCDQKPTGKSEMKVETGFAKANGTILYYETAGKGYPLVLIHGGLMDRRMWDEQFASFAKNYRVIRYNVRGYEKSQKPKPEEPYSHVEDLYALLKYLKVKKTHLLGLSLGGQIAIDFALEHPEMVKTLIPVSSALNGFSYRDEEDYAEKFDRIFKTAKSGNINGAVELLMNLPYFVPVEENPDIRIQMKKMIIDNYDTWSGPQDKLIWSDPAAAKRLKEITVPVLVIVGDHDVSDILNVATALEKNLPNARKITIQHAGHHVNMEQPKIFNKTVLEFLKNPANK